MTIFKHKKITPQQLPKVLIAVLFLWLIPPTIGRLGFYLWQQVGLHRLEGMALGEQLLAFVYGIRIDGIILCMLILPLVLLLCFAPAWNDRMHKACTNTAKWYIFAVFMLLAFMEFASVPFFMEYDVRPNIIFVQYLDYPKEVGSMLWKDQKVSLFISTLLLLAIAYAYNKIKPIEYLSETWKTAWYKRALWFILLLPLLVLGIRSSFGHRPANNTDALYSNNRVANEIVKNPLYSVLYEAYRGREDGESIAKKYGAMEQSAAYLEKAKLLGLANPDAPMWAPANPQSPFSRAIPHIQANGKPKNLVIFIQESMGAHFLGFTGGNPNYTPHLNRLAEEGIAFTQVYSNGTRSIRGLSALSSGFQAMPGEGVLKRPKSQKDFFTVAQLLKPHGYKSAFIYGGEARFDNMKSWYMGNGFDEVIEETDYADPIFKSSWGVSDEDLVIAAHRKFESWSKAGQPFVSVMFSSSNHVPFELPEGKIEWVQGVPKRSVENAIKYADFAIGKFIQLAKQSPYYQDTVFVIAADHNIRVYGDDAIPIEGFHVPALIFGAGVPRMQFNNLASQPDVLATALDFLGLELQYPILGNSIFAPNRSPFVLMRFNETYGFWRGDDIAIYQPDKPPIVYQVRNRKLGPATHNPKLVQQGLGAIHTTEQLYEKRSYR